MEEFKLDNIFNAVSARQDKIELDIGNWSVRCIDIKMFGFIQYLGSNDRCIEQEQHKAFQANNTLRFITKEYITILRPKHGRGYSENSPLFTGHLVITRISPSESSDTESSDTESSGNEESYKLVLKLKINPTRFCAYQETPSRYREDGNIKKNLSETPALFATQNKTSHKNERTLDGKDNALLTPASKSNGSNAFWEQNLALYITTIINYFDTEIDNYRADNFKAVSFVEHYSLKAIETYWDMSCDNPVGTIKALEDDFLALGNNASVSYYQDAGKLIEGSSLALRAEFRLKERLKLYAKTNERIRLEIEYKYNKNASLAEGRTHTAESLDDLISMINFASSQSARLANQFFTSLSEYSNFPEVLRGSALTFIRLLYRQVADVRLAEEILLLLSASGGIPTNKLRADMKKALDSLALAELIKKEKRPINRYVVAPRYFNSIQELK